MLCNSYKNSHFLETSIWSTVSWLSSLLFPKPQALTVSNDVIFISSSECPLPVLMKLFPFIFCFCDIYKNIELAYSSFSTHIHLERMNLTSFTLVLHWINDPSSPNERSECCWRHSISQKITRLHWLCDSPN